MIKNPIFHIRHLHMVLLFTFIIILLIISGPTVLLFSSPTGHSSRESSRIKQWQNDLAKAAVPNNAVKLKRLFSMPGNDDNTDTAGSSEFVFLRYAENLCSDSSGNILVTDSRNHTVYHFGSDGKLLKTTGRKGKGPGDLLSPKHVFMDPKKHLVVHDSSNGRIQVFGPNENYSSSFRPLLKMHYSAHNFKIIGGTMKKKTILFGLALLILAAMPVLYAAWTCYDLPANCGGSAFCDGDVMEGSVCTFRCKTGNTYTDYRTCRQYFTHVPIAIDDQVD
jgi:hypothetical protein